MRRLDRRERCDLLLQLEHDSLRRLLADARNGLEERVVLTDDRATQLARRIARHDRERDLGPDSADGEQLLEKLALVGIGEAEKLHGILTYVQMGLDDYLVRAVRLLHRGRRCEEPVPDAVHVEDEARSEE